MVIFGFHFHFDWSGMVDEKPLVDVLYLIQYILLICLIYLWIGNHYREVQKLPSVPSTSNREVAWYKIFITVKQCSMECYSN